MNIKMWCILLYLLSIVTANILTASYAPLNLGNLIFPVGSFLIGATFIFRDLVQNAVGRRNTYFTIAVALIISAVSSSLLGDGLQIVAASAVAFLFSETTDTEIYSRLKLPMGLRVLYSGIVGGALDSAIFVIIGLSPLFGGFLTWEMTGYAIAGQILVKLAMQFLGAGVLGVLPRRLVDANAAV